MGAQRVVGGDGRGDLVGILRSHAIIDVLAPVAIGPAVEAAFTHRGEVIRHQILAQFVPLVDHCPQLPGARLDRQCRRVAQAGGIGLVGAGFGVDLPDHGAVDFGLHAALGDVAVRADTDIQVAPIRADGQRLGPVMIDLGGQVGDLGRRAAGLGLAVPVIETHQGVLVGHVQLALEQRQSIRRVEVVGEHRLQLVAAVAIGVAQQGQAIATLDRGGALGLDKAGDHILRLEGRRAAAAPLRDEDVAIGQHQRLARDLQIGRDRRDAVTRRHGWRLVAPRHGFGNVHARQQPALGLGQRGRGAVLLGGIPLAAATGEQQGHGRGGQRS